MANNQIQITKPRGHIWLLDFKIWNLFVSCILVTGYLLTGCQNRPLYKDTQVMMGTFIEISSPDKKASGIAFAEIKRIEALLSKYNPESDVSRLNKSGALKVSPDTFFVVKKSIEFWRASEGAFDITVSPLMDLWGFTNRNYYLPSGDELKSALSLVGSDKIILNDADNMIEFMVSGVKIDLGALAKGYALDCAVSRLKKEGVKDCLINAGGQVYGLGDKYGRPWKVAIRDPIGRVPIENLELKDMSVSTSGGYEQYFIKDNKKYPHILNPKTGYPLDSTVESVTVVAPNGLTADALSTAIFVLGKEKGVELAKKFKGVEVKFIE